MMARRALAACLCAGALLPALPTAAQVFTPPPGCTGFLTVQAKGCKVSNHYRCEADAPGTQWRVDFNIDGAYFVSQTDAEAQWLRSVDLRSGVEQELAPDGLDPASFSGLIETGTDTYDFAQISSDKQRNRVRGFDTLTGRKVTIDGIALEETSFEFRETLADGTFRHAARGNEYIHRGWRLFFAGPSEWDDGNGWQPYDRSPMTFAQPGEPGFMSTKPEFDCDAQLARAVPTNDQLARETRHDPL